MPYLTEIQNLRRECVSLHGQMKDIAERNKGKEWSAEDTANFDEIEKSLHAKNAMRVRYEKLDGYLDDDGPKGKTEYQARIDREERGEDPDEYDDTRELREGEDRIHGRIIDGATYKRAVRNYFRRRALTPEHRAVLQADSDVGGGYLITSEQAAGVMLKQLDNQNFIRGMASKFSVPTAVDLGILTLNGDPGTPVKTGELTAATFDSSMNFGKRKMHPRSYSNAVAISNVLMRKALINIENFVFQRFAYVWAAWEEQLFLTGSGAEEPLGLMTPSPDGIPTSRDVQINTSTELNPDALIDVVNTLKPQYAKNAVFGLTRDMMKRIRKAKDTAQGYLWQPSLQLGNPDTVLGYRYFISEYIDQTFGAGTYPGIFGDFSFYWIADALDMEIKVLNELLALTNQTGYIMRREFDGQPVMGEAFVRLKRV